jgi:hypothetical protein
MLLPTERSAGVAATNLMQSMLDKAEERRAEREEETRGKKEDPVLKTQVSLDETRARAREKIETYLFDSAHVSVNELKVDLLERLGDALGLKQQEGESGYGWGRKLEAIVSTMDYSQKRALEKEVGLDKLDLSIDSLIMAVKNPYADDAEKLKAALELKSGGGTDAHVVQSRVLQRLESVADPKTVEELKREPELNDPTRIEDDQVRQERAEEISDKQALAKLEDVRQIQDAGKEPGAEGDADPLDALTVLAGITDATTKADPSASTDAGAVETALAQGQSSEDIEKEAKADLADAGLEPAEPNLEAGDALEPEPLQIHVDEIGLYSLLEKKKAA